MSRPGISAASYQRASSASSAARGSPSPVKAKSAMTYVDPEPLSRSIMPTYRASAARMPVSSSTSRAAATSHGSSPSIRPPGIDHSPRAGSCPRRTSRMRPPASRTMPPAHGTFHVTGDPPGGVVPQGTSTPGGSPSMPGQVVMASVKRCCASRWSDSGSRPMCTSGLSRVAWLPRSSSAATISSRVCRGR